ncbi:unnamed protein product [Choristocarpus tenellus]
MASAHEEPPPMKDFARRPSYEAWDVSIQPPPPQALPPAPEVTAMWEEESSVGLGSGPPAVPPPPSRFSQEQAFPPTVLDHREAAGIPAPPPLPMGAPPIPPPLPAAHGPSQPPLPPPLPPSLPSNAAGAAPGGKEALLASITEGRKLKKVERSSDVGGDGSGGNELLSAIRSGAKLKKVEVAAPAAPAANPLLSGNPGINEILARRKYLEAESEESTDDSDWDED